MKFKKLYFCLSIFTGLAVSGCYSGDKKLVPKPQGERKVIVESYKVDVRPMVDILFVIDNSGSMGSHQENLALNMDVFTQAMGASKFLDYQIGVISTSERDKGILFGVPAFIDRDTPNGLQILQRKIVDLGTGGDATEKMFRPLIDGFGSSNALSVNPGFLREKAFLAIVFLTDTEDQSSNLNAQGVYQALQAQKTGTDKLLGYAALSYPEEFGDDCSQDGGKAPQKNMDFMSLFPNSKTSKVMNGVSTSQGRSGLKNIFSLCNPNFGQIVGNIGEDIRERVAQSIPLPELPVPGTIKLLYDGQPVDKKWWKYNPETISIALDPEIELPETNDPENAELSIVMDQADPKNPIGSPDPNLPEPFTNSGSTANSN